MAQVKTAEPVLVVKSVSKQEISDVLKLRPSPYSLLRQAQLLRQGNLSPEDRQDLEKSFQRHVQHFKGLNKKLEGLTDYGDIIKILNDPQTFEAEPPKDLPEIEPTPSKKGETTAGVPVGLTSPKSAPPTKTVPGSQVKKYLEAQKVASVHLAQLYAQANAAADQTYDLIVARAAQAGLARPERLVSREQIRSILQTAVTVPGLPFTPQSLSFFALKLLESSPSSALRTTVRLAQKAPGPTLSSQVEAAADILVKNPATLQAKAELAQDSATLQALETGIYPGKTALQAARNAIDQNRPQAAIDHLETLKADADPDTVAEIKTLQANLESGHLPSHLNVILDTLTPKHSALHAALVDEGLDPDTAAQIESNVQLQSLSHPLDKPAVAAALLAGLPPQAPTPLRQAIISDNIVDVAQGLSQTSTAPLAQIPVPQNLSAHHQLLAAHGFNPSALNHKEVITATAIILHHQLEQQAVISGELTSRRVSPLQYYVVITSPEAVNFYHQDQENFQHHTLESARELLGKNSILRRIAPETFKNIPEPSIRGLLDYSRTQLGLAPTPTPASPGFLAKSRLFFSNAGQSVRAFFSGGFRSGLSKFASGIGTKLAPLKSLVSRSLALIKPVIEKVVASLGRIVLSVGKTIISWGGKALASLGAKAGAALAALSGPEVLAAIGITAVAAILIVGAFSIWRHYRMTKIESAQNQSLDDSSGLTAQTGASGQGDQGNFQGYGGRFNRFRRNPNGSVRPTTRNAPYTGPALLSDINGLLCWPTTGSIGSYIPESHPSLYDQNTQSAVDIMGQTGDPIIDTIGGKVVVAGWDDGYGNSVTIRTNVDIPGYGTRSCSVIYGHLTTITAAVGQQTSPGTQVGTLGNSNTGSPHLHWEMRCDGLNTNQFSIRMFFPKTDATTGFGIKLQCIDQAGSAVPLPGINSQNP